MTVYKSITLVGTSGTSVSDAIRGAIQRAGETLDDVKWFEVREIRGRVADGEVQEFQVSLDVSFVIHASGGNGSRAGAAKPAVARHARSERAQAASARGERRRSDLARGFDKQPGGRARGRART